MANTFIKISTITVGVGGAASIDFTSIPATYTDLFVQISLRSNYANPYSNPQVRFNGATTNYSAKQLIGSGAAASSAGNSYTDGIDLPTMPASTNTASTFGSVGLYIPNYASANYKSVSSEGGEEGNSATQYMELIAGLWSNTAAINQVTIVDKLGALVQYSSATLYGIKSS